MVPYGRLGDWTTIGTPRAPDAEPGPAPFGVSFTGLSCGEPRLIALAYAFEQLTRRRVPPPLFP
jgi:Asp-tRNA(Asn)/Glu-tRNA(Gln) amidotransferase A subunit family amidase